MVKVQSNFVKGIQNGHNKILTYLTMIFMLAFLACLLAFWVYSYREAVCANCIGGQTCCYTDLQNSSLDNPNLSIDLTQQGTSLAAGSFPQKIIFDYASKSATSENFFLDIENTAFDPAQYTRYPSGHDSGFCMSDDGVSVNIKQYYDDSSIWNESYLVIYEGVSAFMNRPSTIAKGYFEVKQATEGIEYITTSTPEIPKPTISTENSLPSYFKQFGPNQKGAGQYILQIPTKKIDAATYNPLHNLLEAKDKVKNSNQCTDPGVCCQCVDPSSKNLPSCSNPYHHGLGYVAGVDSKNQTIIYSKNCSYTYSRAHGTSHPNVTQNISQLASQGGGISKAFLTATTTPKTDFNTDGGIASNFDGSSFPSDVPITNAFNSTKLFCGGNNEVTNSGPQYMYNTGFSNLTKNSVIGLSVRASTFPNAQVSGPSDTSPIVLGNN